MLVAEQAFGREQCCVLGEVLAVHDQVLPVHVHLHVVDPLGAQLVDHVQRHPDVAHEDLHRRLGVLVLEEHGHAAVARVLRRLADAVDEPPPRVRVRRLERVVVALDPGPDDHVRSELAREIDCLLRQAQRLRARRVVRRREAALREARVEMETARDAVDAVAVERLLHLLEVVGRELLRVVELVVVHQVAETLDCRPHLRRSARTCEVGLVPAGIEPRRHRPECPDAQARLHVSLPWSVVR